MDDDDSTCFGVSKDGCRFQRIMAYIYVPIPVITLILAPKISGMEYPHPGLLVYHGNGYSGMYVEWSLTASRHEGRVQQCEFMWTNICTNQSVVKIYVQIESIKTTSIGNTEVQPRTQWPRLDLWNDVEELTLQVWYPYSNSITRVAWQSITIQFVYREIVVSFYLKRLMHVLEVGWKQRIKL